MLILCSENVAYIWQKKPPLVNSLNYNYVIFHLTYKTLLLLFFFIKNGWTFSLSFCIMRTRQQRAEPPWPSLCSACQRTFASRQQNHNIYFITAFIITDLFIAQSHLNQGTRDCWWIISITFFVDGFNSFERPGTFVCVLLQKTLQKKIHQASVDWYISISFYKKWM